MMKFQAYDEKQNARKTYLRVVNERGSVYLIACDQYGNMFLSGRILIIEDNGTLSLCLNVNPSLGFKLNDRGQIEVT